MKYVKLFESFLNEKEVIAVKTAKLNKSIEEKIKQASELSKELKKLTDEYKAKIEPMQDTLNKYDAEILDTLTSLQVNSVKVKDVIAKVMMQKGRLTDSYKSLWEEALTKVNDSTKKVLLEMQTANKKQNPDKYWMEYSNEMFTAEEIDEMNEGWKDIAKYGKELITRLKTWVRDVWTGLKKKISDYFNSVDNLEAVANKITK